MDTKTRHAPSEVLLEARDQGRSAEGYHRIELVGREGAIAARLYPSAEATRGAIWVGGVGGDWDTPARELYPRLCRALVGDGVASLRLRFRDPHNLVDAVHDVLAGIAYFEMKGINRVALIGHSFGGAVVIQAGALAESVRAVIALATQSHGAEPAAWLAPRCGLLLLHGEQDRVLPSSASQLIYRLAQEPKRLTIYPAAGHNLDEAAGEVEGAVREWILKSLFVP